jgi:hypothetical protein
MRIILALAGLIFCMQALADQYRPSIQAIWTMSDTHLVLHEHDTSRRHTELRIVDRSTGKETYRGDSTTFTLLVPVDGGKYFAGLSDRMLQSLDYGYNFALFTPEGEYLSRAYVTTATGYCGRVRESVSMTVMWFEPAPEISLIYEDEVAVAVKVGRRCSIPLGDHRETRESYQVKLTECRANDCHRGPRPINTMDCKPEVPVIL